jgi:prepilin-type N-terminal cleavage/methylation domain-containing protein
MNSPFPATGRKAFTLLEVLTSVGVIAVLAALLLPALKTARSSADRTEGLSEMRQIGLAIQMFAGDNDGSLPGPLWGGQSPWYRNDASDPKTLGNRLWSYIGAPEPKSWSQEAKALSPKAYERTRASGGAPSYIVNLRVTIGDDNNISPWGGGENPLYPLPLKLAALAASGLSKTWALEDIDKTSPNANSGQGWYSQLPATPIYKPHRLKLYFDWHVAAEPIK